MAKGGKGRKSSSRIQKKKANDFQEFPEDDEIDAFHKQRDVVPLDINDDAGDSDEDMEHPVFDFEDDDRDEDDDDDEGDEDFEDDTQLTGLAAKIARQQKYLRAKIGGVEDEMHDDAKDDEGKRVVWGRNKGIYHGADNTDFEIQSSDEELPAEEEAEVVRLQKERAKSLSMADFGLEDDSQDESDAEPTFEDILVKGKAASKPSVGKGAQNEFDTTYEEVKKDLNALTREEQMDVVYSAAPELIGLLTELNDAVDQLENTVNPLLSKVRDGEIAKKRGLKYLELKQQLLLLYCQSITFYLLLKSEGQPVRDHPVIARLVDIKNLLDKVKKLDENLPTELEDILNSKLVTETEQAFVRQDSVKSDPIIEDSRDSMVPAETKPRKAPELVKIDSLKDHTSVGGKRKHQNDKVDLQSMEMLKVRAALEEKLRQKGVFSSIASKSNVVKKNLQPLNGQLETLDDFDDDTIDNGGRHGMSNGHAHLSNSNPLSQIAAQRKKAKIVSGDDDLPKRDDIGQRRRKHEQRVLAGAGIKSDNDMEDEEPNNTFDSNRAAHMDEDNESDYEFYKQVEKQREAKLAAKAGMYSRTPAVPSLPEILVDGKRNISYQMEKNRGLTRARNKAKKNPRKNNRMKHQKAVTRRKGQVREIKKPGGPYGGETSGINAGISRSIRFKN